MGINDAALACEHRRARLAAMAHGLPWKIGGARLGLSRATE